MNSTTTTFTVPTSSDQVFLYPAVSPSSTAPSPTSFAEGSQMLVSPWIGPIDTSITHVLQGHFKAIGTTPSVIHFGLDCAAALPVLDKPLHKNRVRDVDVFMVPDSEARVEKYDEATYSIQVTADSKDALKNWNQQNTPMNKRLIAFYFDGNTNRKPDFVHLHQGRRRGGYHSPSVEEGRIRLEDPSVPTPASPLPTSNVLPKHMVKRIVPNKTVVRCHYADTTYLFLGPKGQKLEPGKWQFFCNTLRGEAFQNDPTHFRMGTKYVRIVLLANWEQKDTDTALLFKNISFTQCRSYDFLPADYATPALLPAKKTEKKENKEVDEKKEKKADKGNKGEDAIDQCQPAALP